MSNTFCFRLIAAIVSLMAIFEFVRACVGIVIVIVVVVDVVAVLVDGRCFVVVCVRGNERVEYPMSCWCGNGPDSATDMTCAILSCVFSRLWWPGSVCFGFSRFLLPSSGNIVPNDALL